MTSQIRRAALGGPARRAVLAAATLLLLILPAWLLNLRPSGDSEAGPPRPAPAAAQTDSMIAALQERLRQHPDDAESYTRLGAAYLQKVRDTGDPSFYPKAEEVLQRALALQPNDAETLTTLGVLALAQHDFAAGLDYGEQARALNPYSARALGVIVDGQVELGRYEEAFESAQAMVDLRPDMNSYARVSYMRELQGDVTSAIELMRLAARAGSGVPENAAWTHTQLGSLLFEHGDADGARQAYEQALRLLPGFAPAEAGLARLEAAQGNLDAAIARYEAVTQRMPLAEYVIALGECYEAAGRTKEAEQQYALVQALDQLQQANGVDTQLEITLFEADHPGRLRPIAETVARARETYERRPTIYAADALAWALYQAGDYAEAQRYAKEALRLNTQDALLWFHAGMIAAELGQAEAARAALQHALDINPHFSLRWAPVAQAALASE